MTNWPTAYIIALFLLNMASCINSARADSRIETLEADLANLKAHVLEIEAMPIKLYVQPILPAEAATK